MTRGSWRVAPTGGPATVVALAIGYALVSLVVDPLVTTSGPHHVILRPSAGLPVLFGIAAGPVGVVGAVGGAVVEAAFVGGDLGYSLSMAVGRGAAAAVAWRCWSPGDDRSVTTGRWRLLLSFIVCTVAAASVGNALFGGLAATVAGYPFAPLAVEGAVGTIVSTIGLAAGYVLLDRFDVLPESMGPGADWIPNTSVERGLLLAVVGLAWLGVATATDTVVHDLELLPPPVVEQHVPHRIVGVFEFAAHTLWVGQLLQFCIAAVALVAVVGLLPTAAVSAGGDDERPVKSAADDGNTNPTVTAGDGSE
ncbi:hypothetical protein [Haloarchaeobius litoreus]|uniref:Energy-coupling factor transport system substrate-specific component n=1 Tax=Haloarchaeobius litoreus TaxID=755306 RepID=A0ABD6DRI5_9EURY|nr:hypothetical protein [Haloarchaeobius litoreus]